MQRHDFQHGGLTLSYLDTGGDGRVLVALHAHWMEGLTFAPLAAELAPEWRVIALDQRGHGHSDHAPTSTRDDYLGDLVSLFEHLALKNAVILGNSLGGVNAYTFAARQPARVIALIIEDMGVEESPDADFSFVLAWQGTFATREELAERVGPRYLPYLQDSFRQTPAVEGSKGGGWKLAFDPQEMIESQRLLNGDHWADWLASRCPALLIRGLESKVTPQSHAEQMAARRPNTRLVTLEGGHVVHFDNLSGFTDAVKTFLKDLPREHRSK